MISWQTLGLLIPISPRLSAVAYMSIVADHVHEFIQCTSLASLVTTSESQHVVESMPQRIGAVLRANTKHWFAVPNKVHHECHLKLFKKPNTNMFLNKYHQLNLWTYKCSCQEKHRC